MNKMFLVLGPESSGNHLCCRVLDTMGAWGTHENGAYQLLDSYVYCMYKEDLGIAPPVTIKKKPTPNIREIIGDSTNIYLRRSVPYGRDWPDIVYMRNLFLKDGFEMYTIVLVRDWASNILSNYYVRMDKIEDAVEAEPEMWCWIGERLRQLHPFIFVNTSFMMKDPEPVIKQLEIFTGLKWPKGVAYHEVVRDSDRRRHQQFLKYGYNITDRQQVQ